MQELWRLGRASVHDVVGALHDRQPAYTTVLTTLRNLERKGYLRHETLRRQHIYIPRIAQRCVARRSLFELLESLFGGSKLQLAATLFEDEELSDAELQKLRERIAALRAGEAADD